MRRLVGEDAGFLALELPIQPMNTLVLALLRPPAPISLDYVRRHLALRLDELPAFRWRVEPVPLGLHHPVYISDPSFDLDDHLREVTLPAPAGPTQLDRFCAALAERSLDRRRPLWQLTLVGGLEDGRQAIVLRVHHCMMDGFATTAALSRIFSGEDHRVTAPSQSWRSEARPRPSRLVVDALRDQVTNGRRLPALIRTTWHNLAALRANRSATTAPAVPRPGADAPASIMNRALTADRRFARTSLPTADLKLVKNAAGVTLNDVALAVVSGALRAYLQARDALPARSLVASVPVGLEPPGAAPRTFGNRFSSITTTLATDIADPWARLQVISAVTAEAKRGLLTMGPELLVDWLDFVPPAVAERAVRLHARRRRRHPERVDVNLVVSNIRGPDRAWSFGPALVEEVYLAGPPNNGAGANVVLWDYGDRVLFGILTFADSVEAPNQLADGLKAALAELVALAEAR